MQSDDTQNGTIDLSIKLKFNYIPPRAGTRTAAQLLASGADLRHEMALLPGEDDALRETVHAGAPR